MSTYQPVNLAVYSAAYSGAYSGLSSSSRWLVDANIANYVGFAMIAAAYAQTFDTQWGSAQADTVQMFCIQQISKSVWEGRNSSISNATTNPSNYIGIVNAVIAAIQSGDNILLNAGIAPSPWPGTTPPQSIQDIFIDPQNRTGNANDNNVGTQAQPVRTWNGGVIRRYGMTSPILGQGLPVNSTITYHFMSSSPADGSDPVIFNPLRYNQTAMRFVGTTDNHNLVKNGNLANVTAKNKNTPQFLQADLGAGVSVGMTLINNTRAAICKVIALVAGTTFVLSQPQTISLNWPLSGDPSIVDTFANGDSFSLYNQDQVDFAQLDSISTTWDPVTANQFTVVTNLDILSPTATSNPCYLGDGISFLYSTVNRRCVVKRGAMFKNVLFWGGFGRAPGGIISAQSDIDAIGNQTWLFGGAWQRCLLTGGRLDDDVIFSGGVTARMVGGTIGSMAIDAGSSLLLEREVLLTPNNTTATIWGNGLLNIKGTGRLSISGATAVSSLLNKGGTQINSQTNGFTATAANPSVINGNNNITPANIDAAPLGQIFVPGGGSIATFG
jgi:hypothetical protein